MSEYVRVARTPEKASLRTAPKAMPTKNSAQFARAQAAKQVTLQLLREQAGKQAALQLFREQAQQGQALRGAEVVQMQDVRDEEEDVLQGRFDAVQRVATDEVDKDVQMQQENRTGMPDGLKAGVENLSGLSMDEVRVHYNSDRPAKVQALAYTQGTDIHVAPGQERHLPHEAWHVVQQAQGRVQPTMQLQELGGVGVNDDAGLEHEADVMGGRALVSREELRRVVPTEAREGLEHRTCPSVPVPEKQTDNKNRKINKPIIKEKNVKNNIFVNKRSEIQKMKLQISSRDSQFIYPIVQRHVLPNCLNAPPTHPWHLNYTQHQQENALTHATTNMINNNVSWFIKLEHLDGHLGHGGWGNNMTLSANSAIENDQMTFVGNEEVLEQESPDAYIISKRINDRWVIHAHVDGNGIIENDSGPSGAMHIKHVNQALGIRRHGKIRTDLRARVMQTDSIIRAIRRYNAD